MPQTMIFWDKAHYTQNDNHALLGGALSKKVKTHPIIKRKGPSQREAGITHVLELLFYKTDV